MWPTSCGRFHGACIPRFWRRAASGLPFEEVTAYYVVSEALTNAAKHARASVVWVDVAMVDHVVRLLVQDDGVGGADPSRGSGLIGLSDRVEAVGGRIEITNPPGGGTWLLVTIPSDRPPEP